MIDTLELKPIVSKALDNAQAAGLSVPQQIDHVVRSVRQVHPEIDKSDAVRRCARQMAKLDDVTRSGQAKDPVLREYERLAARYDRRWSFYVEATIREMLRRLAPRPGDKVLDVGCGTGALLQALSLSFPGVVLAGVDLSSEMLGVAQSKIGSSVKLRRGRAETLPFESKTFDIVLSTSLLHYLRAPDDALLEMKRVLKPGGQVIVSDWCDDYLACRLCDRFLRLFNRAHFKTYGSPECVELMKAAGFESIDVERFKISWLWGLMTAHGKKPA